MLNGVPSLSRRPGKSAEPGAFRCGRTDSWHWVLIANASQIGASAATAHAARTLSSASFLSFCAASSLAGPPVLLRMVGSVLCIGLLLAPVERPLGRWNHGGRRFLPAPRTPW